MEGNQKKNKNVKEPAFDTTEDLLQMPIYKSHIYDNFHRYE